MQSPPPPTHRCRITRRPFSSSYAATSSASMFFSYPGLATTWVIAYIWMSGLILDSPLDAWLSRTPRSSHRRNTRSTRHRILCSIFDTITDSDRSQRPTDEREDVKGHLRATAPQCGSSSGRPLVAPLTELDRQLVAMTASPDIAALGTVGVDVIPVIRLMQRGVIPACFSHFVHLADFSSPTQTSSVFSCSRRREPISPDTKQK